MAVVAAPCHVSSSSAAFCDLRTTRPTSSGRLVSLASPICSPVLRLARVVYRNEPKLEKGRRFSGAVAEVEVAEADIPAVAPSPTIPRPKKIGQGIVRLRLARYGRKKRPFYRIVATHSSWRRDGKYIELLGHYNPLHAPNDLGIVVKADRIKYWLGVGGQPSDTVMGILHKVGIFKAEA